MLDANINIEKSGILEKAYADFIGTPLAIRRKLKYKDLDISIDENGNPVITDINNEIVDGTTLDLNDNTEILKNVNLLATLVLLDEKLLNRIKETEKELNKLDTEFLLSFIEESKKINSPKKREILVDYIAEKLLCDQTDDEISCRTIEIIRNLSKGDIENLQILKSLLVTFPITYHTLTKEILSYKEPMLLELQSDIELQKFCNLRYGFLKRLETLGLISTNLMTTTIDNDYICIGSKCYKHESRKDPISMTNIYLGYEIREILSVLHYGEIKYEDYKSYIERTHKFKIIESELIMVK